VLTQPTLEQVEVTRHGFAVVKQRLHAAGGVIGSSPQHHGFAATFGPVMPRGIELH